MQEEKQEEEIKALKKILEAGLQGKYLSDEI